MDLEIRVLSGDLAGRVFRASSEGALVGRHPEAEVRFDPEGDLEVSTRHARVEVEDGRWVVRDLASRNGTWLNGRRVEGSTPLRDGDRISFGTGGPAVEVRLVPAERGPVHPTLTGGIPASGTTERIRVAVSRETRALRRAAVVLGGLLLLAGVALALALQSGRIRETAWERERALLVERLDSALGAGEGAVRSLEGQVEGLAEALQDSRAEVRDLRARLARSTPRDDPVEIEALRAQLQTATAALERQSLAAALDFRSIEADNGAALAMIYVESAAGEVSAATAFAVREDALLLTARHVVAGPDGTARPRRLAVQFAGSRQVWPARIVALSPAADLALVQADNVVGSVPAVKALNQRADTVRPGMPVALMGFPLGGDASMPAGSGGAAARPLPWAGVVSASLPGRLEIHGYGERGASGSPVFDGNGEVVAVLFGGREEAGGRVLLGVPVTEARALLAGR